MADPAWFTKRRREILARVFETGEPGIDPATGKGHVQARPFRDPATGGVRNLVNECLLGHPSCTLAEHFIRQTAKVEWVRTLQKDLRLRQVFGEPGDIEFPTWLDVPKHNLEQVRVPVGEEVLTNAEAIAHDLAEIWKASDREDAKDAWERERKELGPIQPVTGFGPFFDPVRRDELAQNRQEYYLRGAGMDPLTLERFALVRIPATTIGLLVDLTRADKKIGKWARKKARARGEPLPVQPTDHEVILDAVRAWWTDRGSRGIPLKTLSKITKPFLAET